MIPVLIIGTLTTIAVKLTPRRASRSGPIIRLMDARERSSHWVGLGDHAWRIETVWRAAGSCPIEETLIESIQELDEDCWFSGDNKPATVRAIADHARRINEADLGHPIILSSDGHVLDGMHRVARAFLEGRRTVKARRLIVDPEPDWTPTSET